MTTSNNRFAWLTPVSGQDNNQGPWVLVHNDTQRFAYDGSTAYRRISISGLLQFASGVLDIPKGLDQSRKQLVWKSACNRYRVEWHRHDGDGSRLFKQRPEDHFARIEIWIDKVLQAAFEEPVWPQLHESGSVTTNRLMIPTDLLTTLEASSLKNQKPSATIERMTKAQAA